MGSVQDKLGQLKDLLREKMYSILHERQEIMKERMLLDRKKVKLERRLSQGNKNKLLFNILWVIDLVFIIWMRYLIRSIILLIVGGLFSRI